MASWLAADAGDPLSALSRAVRLSQRTKPSTVDELGLCAPCVSRPAPAYPSRGEHENETENECNFDHLAPTELLKHLQSLYKEDDEDVNMLSESSGDEVDEDAHIDDVKAFDSPDTASHSSSTSQWSSSSNGGIHNVIPSSAGPLRPPNPSDIDPLQDVIAAYLDLLKLTQTAAAQRQKRFVTPATAGADTQADVPLTGQLYQGTSLNPSCCMNAATPVQNNQDPCRNNLNQVSSNHRPLTVPVRRSATLNDARPLSSVVKTFNHSSSASKPALTLKVIPPWSRSRTTRPSRAARNIAQRTHRLERSSSANTYDSPTSSRDASNIFRVLVKQAAANDFVTGASMVLRLSQSDVRFALPNGREMLKAPYTSIRRYGYDARCVKLELGGIMGKAAGLYILQCHTPALVIQSLNRSMELDSTEARTTIEPKFI
eukprot:TRINITY_DN12057_c4_g1_i1.p1 TRINITY_DN12057_c4_g1~~TRINITY_DN12057_c4_g1_i1.p1  ORF type:complete len:430 (+),score=71.43 TRINITY_DN12057_c4_g1_i1:204-1493(+)